MGWSPVWVEWDVEEEVGFLFNLMTKSFSLVGYGGSIGKRDTASDAKLIPKIDASDPQITPIVGTPEESGHKNGSFFPEMIWLLVKKFFGF